MGKRGGKGTGRGISRAKANKAKFYNIITCPSCDKPLTKAASMSRYVNLYICSDCGTKEAFTRSFFWAAKFEREQPTQPANFDPYE